MNHFSILGFFLRLCIAIWNGFFGPSFGAEFDAQGAHLHASFVSQNLDFDDFHIGPIPYVNVLGFFYWLITDSLFLGSFLSCIAWLVSAQILASCMRLLSVEKKMQAKAMLIYALLPSSIFLTSVTLREPYQLLFVNIAIYAVLQIYMRKNIKHWFTLLFAVAGAGSLHGALMSCGIFLLAGTLLLTSLRGKRVSWLKIIPLGVVAACVLGYGFIIFGENAYDLEGGIVTSIDTYQQGLLSIDARTHYKSESQGAGLGSLLLFMQVSFVQYLFEPFPWHISAASDVVVLLENVLRGWLIWRAWKTIRIASAPQRNALFLIFVAYLVMETIWSIGTINWGTSTRHHLPAWGLLLLAAYATSPRKIERNNRAVFTKWRQHT
ncbi:MAG: hypothetical protein EXR81_01705 [Gammaproteobacteria bacterium]|nr:hypothetical protein [Gammaproteobacteria bacterium]